MEFKTGDIVKWNGKRISKDAEFIGYVKHTSLWVGDQKAMIHVFGNKKTSIVLVSSLEMIEENRDIINTTSKSPFGFSI